MNLDEFTIGSSYAVTTKDWTTPLGDLVLGKSMTVTVLPPQELGEATTFDGDEVVSASALEVETRKSFLRVRRPDGKVQLLDPEIISTCSLIN